MTQKKGQSREEGRALDALRAICGVLPESVETRTFGHPTFQAGKKRTYVVLDDHERPDMLCLVFKADLAEQARLVDGEVFFPCKFGAKHGWTSMRVDARTDWAQAKELVVASYRRVALKRMVAALDGHRGPG